MESGVVTLRRNRADRRNKPSNKLVGLAVVVIVIALVLFFNSRSKEIQARNAEDAARIEELESNIDISLILYDSIMFFNTFMTISLIFLIIPPMKGTIKRPAII